MPPVAFIHAPGIDPEVSRHFSRVLSECGVTPTSIDTLSKLPASKSDSKPLLFTAPQAFTFGVPKDFDLNSFFVVLVLDKQITKFDAIDRRRFHVDAIISGISQPDVQEVSQLVTQARGAGCFGLDLYMLGSPPKSKTRIHNHREKEAFLDDLMEGIRSLKGPGIMDKAKLNLFSARVAIVADELILNGVFRANPRLRGSDDSEGFQLNANESIDVEWRFDGRMLGLAVGDPFGLLRKETVLDYTVREVARSSTSLGKGLQIGYAYFDRIIINVAKNTRTEIIGLLDIIMPLTQRLGMPKGLSYYEQSPRQFVA